MYYVGVIILQMLANKPSRRLIHKEVTEVLTNIYELERQARELPTERIREVEAAQRAELATGRMPGEGSGEPIARRRLLARPTFGAFANRIGQAFGR